MNKLTAFIQRAPKRTSAVLAMIVTAIVVPLALNAWGPARDTFTIEKPASYITFNSITNNPHIGDERNFVGIRESGTNNKWSDEMTVQSGKEYTVRMYVHNNAASNLNLVAENVTAKFNLPTTTAKSIQVNGFLSASNAKPGEVYDHAIFKSDRDFNLAVVPGSIIYENNKGTRALPESIFTSAGAKLGYDKMDGRIPGCFEYAGYVSFKVKPQIQQTLNFDIQKTVRKSGDKDFVENVKTAPGEKVDFQIHFKNTDEATLNKVVIRDMLPKGLTYVPGTTVLHNTNGTRTVADGITTGGIEIGNYGKGGGAYLKFTAEVAKNGDLPACGTNTLKNVARATTEGYQKDDDATVTVEKDCPPEPPKPIYTCNALEVKKIERTKFEFSTTYTAQSATFKHITYVVKNAAGTEVYRGQNPVFTTETVGKYTVESFVTFTVNGTDQTVTGAGCKGAFEVTEKPVTPNPGVKIEKKVDGEKRKTVAVDQEFTYQITVKNTGNVDLKNVKVTDPAPADVQFISTDKGTIANNAWSYTIPELKVGQSASFSIKAKAIKSNLTGIKNTACVDAPEVPGTPDDCDDATIVVPPTPVPGVEIDKKIDGVEHKKVAVGQEFTYQITVRNTGTMDLKDVKITDNAPAHVQFISAATGTLADNKWSHTIPELKVNQSISFAIKAKVTKEVEGVIKNTACVDAPQVPGTPDDCDDATVEVPKTPTPPVDNDIKVCDTKDNTIITIKESEFNNTRHTTDFSKCAEVPTPTPEQPTKPTIPSELPTTGFSDGIMAFLGLGSLVASTSYYVISRRIIGSL